MLVRGRWRTLTGLISIPMTPHVALSLTVAVKFEPHDKAASSLQFIRRLPMEELCRFLDPRSLRLKHEDGTELVVSRENVGRQLGRHTVVGKEGHSSLSGGTSEIRGPVQSCGGAPLPDKRLQPSADLLWARCARSIPFGCR